MKNNYILQNNLDPYALIIYDDAIVGDAWEVERYLRDTIKNELDLGNYERVASLDLINILSDMQELNLDDELIKIEYGLMGDYNIVIYQEKEGE